ncbi:MAG TPA: DUF975 family protein [Clostridiaceae bacterium]|nr:DUF975 family protein [Clostridiaceae bacterium]
MNRALIKQNSKRYLSGKYGDALGVAVIASLLGGMASQTLPLISGSSSSPARYFSDNGIFGLDDRIQLGEWMEVVTDFVLSVVLQTWFLLLLAFFFLLVIPLYKTFVSNVIAVGRERWFLRSTHLDIAPPVRLMFSPFRKGEYGKTAGGMFRRSFWLYLWNLPANLALLLVLIPTLLVRLYIFAHSMAFTEANILLAIDALGLPRKLFSLPLLTGALLVLLAFSIIGLVKKYQYSLVPYLLADNPHLGGKRALALSRAMTRGRLWFLYVLDLSFIGWLFLASLCICMPWVTLHLVAPYYHMTWAETYNLIRDESAGRGLLSMEELGYVRLG